MKQKSFELKSKLNESLNTEIAFAIATSRAEGVEIVKMILAPEIIKKEAFVMKTLRNMKANGKIQLFERSENLASDTTEARYLRNKYLDLIKESTDEHSYIIKL